MITNNVGPILDARKSAGESLRPHFDHGHEVPNVIGSTWPKPDLQISGCERPDDWFLRALRSKRDDLTQHVGDPRQDGGGESWVE